jgi:hypothetical protein
MKIKTEQFPKFDERWPIVFFQPTDQARQYFKKTGQDDSVQSVRKSISLD